VLIWLVVTPAGEWIWSAEPADTLQPEYRLRLCRRLVRMLCLWRDASKQNMEC